jgi:hypothetical protein
MKDHKFGIGAKLALGHTSRMYNIDRYTHVWFPANNIYLGRNELS